MSVVAAVVLAASTALLAPAAPAGAGGTRPVASVSASPARVQLAARGRDAIVLRNAGTAAVVIEVAPRAVGLDVRGRPFVDRRPASRRSAARWLTVRPRRLSLRGGGTGRVELVARAPIRAEPGDHHALVLVVSRPVHGARVSVRMRLGVRVVVQVPGRIVRRLAIRAIHVRRARSGRFLDVAVANLGNVTESLARRRLTVTLLARGRVAARLQAAPRELLPRTGGYATVHYRGRLRGPTVARVRLHGARSRSFRIRL
ncbi:MAG TPA: hypothetical protein VLB86_15725 [Gaiellaceae bacterium]|nr:hypothetical protein [Gaiellaceae bacterium]